MNKKRRAVPRLEYEIDDDEIPREGTDPDLVEIVDLLGGFCRSLPFDPPKIAKWPLGEKATTKRALYLMIEGLESLKSKYPKVQRAAAVAAPADSESFKEDSLKLMGF